MGPILRSFSLILFLYLGLSSGVDRNNFKSCDQSSFCRRCRKMEQDKSVYELDTDSVRVEETQLTAKVVNTENLVQFILTLQGLKDSTLRVRLEEAEPLRKRFEIPFVLDGTPVPEKIQLASKTDKNVLVDFQGYKIELNVNPFKLNVYQGEELLISANARGLLRFEHTRQKPEQRDETEDPGTWEENFKSHQDSKPHGPTAVALDFSFPDAQAAYGLPEHADSLALQTTTDNDPYRLYNLDVFEYELDSRMALYAAIPLLITHSEKRTLGLFWFNPSETWIDIDSGSKDVMSSIVNFVSGGQKPQVDSHFMSESGNLEFFLLLGPKPFDVFRQYGKLTGTASIPPFFSLGYHQSRWNYNDQNDVNAVNLGFDDHDIPMDVMWLDIEYTDNKKYFTWDPYKFSNPIEMQQNLTLRGRKLVVIIDPHIKREAGYFVHTDATNNKYYVKDKDGNDYDGWCWPGSSGYLDFLNPEVMNYYSSRYMLSAFTGSTEDMHLWNDMNEPSVFNGPEITMPKDNIHHGDWEHREIHNMYGLLQTMGTHKGLIARSNTDLENANRPFILTRSAFAGSQRFTAIWTGDNAAQWSHLAASIPMCLSLALGGMSFTGADVGGFFQNPDRDLFIRWYQTGAFLPFFRAHSHIETKRREPWVFDKEATSLIRDAIRKRYSFLPYWYTLFYKLNTTGAPVIRPLWVEFPTDSNTFTIQDSFLVGDGILARPVTEPGVTQVSIYFPGEKTLWYDIDTWEVYTHGKRTFPVDMAKIPVFQRGGTIIPKKERIRRSASLMLEDPFTLVITLDSEGKAEGDHYLDDGETYKHRFRKDSSVLIHYDFVDNKLSSSIVGENRFDTPAWVEKVIIVGMKPGSYKATASSDKGDVRLETTYDAVKKTLVIRKPALPISKEWTINIH